MTRTARIGLVVVLAAVLLLPSTARAHCDGMDGPVVTAAQAALASGNVNPLLAWVRAGDEAEVRRAFDRARDVRKAGGAARDLADRYFFEIVVRLHRAGEGEPYSGLQPAGRDLGPAIPAADAALASGSVDALIALLTTPVTDGVGARVARTREAKARAATGDVVAGREYVAAYVELLNYVEKLHALAAGDRPRDPSR